MAHATAPKYRRPHKQHLGKVYCDAIFDGYLCWPLTPAGVTAFLPCPPTRLSDTSMKAWRRCGTLGQWLGKHPSGDNDTSQKGWTNYTSCFPPLVQTLFKTVDEGETDSQIKYNEIAMWTRYLEIVGFFISLVALLMSLTIFNTNSSLHNNRTWIHKNLFTAMVLQELIRLTLYIDQGFIRARLDDPSTDANLVFGISNMDYICEASYVLLEYCTTAMWLWMLIEGLYLRNMVTGNALRDRISHSWYYALGWGLPLLITALWATLTALHYRSEKCYQCWYGYNFTKLYWILQGPRLSVIIVNFVFLMNIMKVVIERLHREENNEVQKIRKAVRAALILLPLLGITNLFNMTEAPLSDSVLKFAIWSFVTHFLRSFQGFFLALIYCFLNGEVIEVLTRQYQAFSARRADARRNRELIAHIRANPDELEGHIATPEDQESFLSKWIPMQSIDWTNKFPTGSDEANGDEYGLGCSQYPEVTVHGSKKTRKRTNETEFGQEFNDDMAEDTDQFDQFGDDAIATYDCQTFGV